MFVTKHLLLVIIFLFCGIDTHTATANKINIIIPKRAADGLCFHISGVKFWNSLPNHITSIFNLKPFMLCLNSCINSLTDV